MALIRKYRFNNNTGLITHDDSVNHIDAELSGTAQFTPNGTGLALLNYPCIMPDTGFPTGVSVRYCSFWFQSTNMAERRLFLYGSNWGNMFEFQANCVGVNSTGYAWFSTWHDVGIYATTYPVCDGSWHFIEYINDSDYSYSLYIDTVSVGSFFSAMPTVLNGTAQIGFADGDGFDEFCIMDTIPTDGERDVIFALGSGGELPPPPPVAAFHATPLSGIIPLSIQFTDDSTETPTSWLWNFGDGGTSTAQNPLHIYQGTGTFTVSLKATNAGGENTCTKIGYIQGTTGYNSILLSKNRIEYTCTPPPSTTGNSLLYDRDITTQWTGWSEDDLKTETITFDLPINRTFDRVILLNHNLKKVVIRTGGTVLLTMDNITTPYFYGILPLTTATTISIDCTTTQVPNQKKKIGEWMICEHYYTLARNPSKIDTKGREKTKEISLADGTLKIAKIAGSERVEFGWEFAGINLDMCSVLENLKRTAYKQPFTVYPFPAELPQEVYLMSWTNPFTREMQQGWDGAGDRVFTMKMELKEV